ncbi:hypothetical protein ATANTOWER_021177 [Ataeniobius toweri]|uniref:Uncharacterized protein n=1 Tax=Ataeniobius toweri TaxID=208326 RepID=A0ABU7CAN5_9TELE|nr:hypothetical protein [Ataeniobius toweri]
MDFSAPAEGVSQLKVAMPSTYGPCSILQLQAQPLKELTKPNSEEYSPACPPSNVPLKSQQRFAAEKGTTPTGDYWNKPAHSLPTTATVEKDLFPHRLAQTTNSINSSPIH